MKLPSAAIAWSTGIAIFSMFFGSGNVVFPLLLGQVAGEHITWALLGLTITAVGGPLLGLLGCVLYKGNCKAFFYRLGTWPGYLVVLLILALLGPVGVMPRCFVVAYGAIKGYFPSLSLFAFNMMAGMVTLLLIARRHFIIPILGYVLSPLLILTLLIIIGISLLKLGALSPSPHTAVTAFLEGLTTGYDTMDLFASILFSVSIWMLLQEKLKLTKEKDIKEKLIPTYVVSSLIGGGLLGLIYLGLCFSAAIHHQAIANVPAEQVLANLAIHLLGAKLAMVANVAVALACLTTVMSLAVAVVDVLHVEIINTSLGASIPFSYGWMMFITMVLTVIFANLGFDGIMNFLHPVMEVGYPAIIVLTLCNIFYKLTGFSTVKIPVYGTLLATILWKINCL